MSNQTPAYRQDIDGIRAVAVGLVLLFHFDLLPFSRAGFIGVDVFYVISGFLITGIIVRDLDARNFSLRDFYLKRVRRLAPALLCMQVLTIAVGVVLLLPADLMELGRQILVTQLYVANVYFWRTYDYFGYSAHSAFLLHTWSLAVEEQFYLFFPLLLIAVYRFSRRYLDGFLLLIAVLSFALNVWQVHVWPGATFYLLPTRAWELLIGALAARLIARGGMQMTRWRAEFLAALGLGLLAAGVVSYSTATPFPGYFALYPTLAAFALLISGSWPNTTASLLSAPPMRYLGAISYPVYLVHWPVHIFADRLLNESANRPAWRWAMLALSLALAALIYHLVETPVRMKIRFRMPRTLLSGYLASSIMVVLISGIFLATRGLPARFPKTVIDLANFAEDRVPPLSECQWTPRFSKLLVPCRIGAPVAETWIVFGDSHAWATHDAFDQWLSRRGESGQLAFSPACLPLFGVHMAGDEGKCYGFNQSVHNYLAAHPSITNVVLVSTWLEAVDGQLSNAPDKVLSGEASKALFYKSFASTLETLKGMGRKVYIWEPVPGAKRSVPQAMAMAVLRKQPLDISFTTAEYEQQFAFLFSAERQNASLITARFSPAKALCSNEGCKVSVSGRPLYFDNAHPSRSSVETWIGILNAYSKP